jgi:hypothetical protein
MASPNGTGLLVAVDNPSMLSLLAVEDQVILVIGIDNPILAERKREMSPVTGAKKPGVRGSGYVYAAATKPLCDGRRDIHQDGNEASAAFRALSLDGIFCFIASTKASSAFICSWISSR